jgi:hypothetical protein
MDSSISIKPRPGATARSNALRDPIAVRAAAETELDPERVVTAAADGGAKQNNKHGPHQEAVTRDFTIDPKSQEALFNAVDVRSAQIESTPNQVLLRHRAYRQQSAPNTPHKESSQENPADPHADFEA